MSEATKLAQAIGLSGGTRSPQVIQLDDPPILANASPAAIQRFNEDFKTWVRKQEVRLSEQIVKTAQG